MSQGWKSLTVVRDGSTNVVCEFNMATVVRKEIRSKGQVQQRLRFTTGIREVEDGRDGEKGSNWTVVDSGTEDVIGKFVREEIREECGGK